MVRGLPALLVLLAGCGGEEAIESRAPVFGPSRVLVEGTPAPAAPVAERGRPALSFLALGDTGWGGAFLRDNAAAMDRLAAEEPVDFVLLLGDNFYRSGVASADDPLWRERFEAPFDLPNLQVPFRAALGNHDHEGDPDAQVARSGRDGRWSMPARRYRFTEELDEGATADFFVLDTQPIHTGNLLVGGQLRWIEAQLRASRARWRIVVGHHPALSHGNHGSDKRVARDLAPLFERHGVDLYLSGHDHDLQVLDSGKGWLQVVSGAGSSTRDVSWGEGTLFAAAEAGFVRVGLSARELWVEVFSAGRGRLHALRRRK